MSYLHYDVVGEAVAVITIDRPENHNVLDRGAQHQYDEFLAAANADPAVRCIVLAGAGGKALSAGWDINEMVSLGSEENAQLIFEREEWLWRWYTSPTPTVAAMGGIAYGVGAYLAACADLRVGGPSSRLKVTGMSFGYASLTWLLADLIGTPRAKDVLFTGRAIGGQECADVGFLNRLVPDDQVRETAIRVATEVAALPGEAVRDAKRLMREGTTRDHRARYDAENLLARQALAARSIADLFSSFTDASTDSSDKLAQP